MSVAAVQALPELTGRGSHRLDHVARVIGKDLVAYDSPDALVIPGSINPSTMSASAVISTIDQDRSGDIMIPEGCQEYLPRYRKNPVVCFNHQSASKDFPIGRSEDRDRNFTVKIEPGRRILATCHFSQANPDGTVLFGLVDEGTIRMTSIGFLPHVATRIDGGKAHREGKPPSRFLISAWEMLEWSWVVVPDNPFCEAVRRFLDLGHVAGEKISPWMRKNLEVYIPEAPEWANGVELLRLDNGDGNQVLNVKRQDATGHEHAGDGRFGSGAGESASPAVAGQKVDMHASAGEKATSLLQRAKELPGQAAEAAKQKVQAHYAKLEGRYGRPMALTILAAGLAAVPIPLPGSSILAVAPLIGVAELYRAMRGAKSKATKGQEPVDAQTDTPPSDEEVAQLGQDFLKTILREWQDEQGVTDSEQSKDGLSTTAGSDGGFLVGKEDDETEKRGGNMATTKSEGVAGQEPGQSPAEAVRDNVPILPDEAIFLQTVCQLYGSRCRQAEEALKRLQQPQVAEYAKQYHEACMSKLDKSGKMIRALYPQVPTTAMSCVVAPAAGPDAAAAPPAKALPTIRRMKSMPAEPRGLMFIREAADSTVNCYQQIMQAARVVEHPDVQAFAQELLADEKAQLTTLGSLATSVYPKSDFALPTIEGGEGLEDEAVADPNADPEADEASLEGGLGEGSDDDELGPDAAVAEEGADDAPDLEEEVQNTAGEEADPEEGAIDPDTAPDAADDELAAENAAAGEDDGADEDEDKGVVDPDEEDDEDDEEMKALAALVCKGADMPDSMEEEKPDGDDKPEDAKSVWFKAVIRAKRNCVKACRDYMRHMDEAGDDGDEEFTGVMKAVMDEEDAKSKAMLDIAKARYAGMQFDEDEVETKAVATTVVQPAPVVRVETKHVEVIVKGRLTRIQKSVCKEAADYMDEASDEKNFTRQQRAGHKYHAAGLRKMATDPEPAQDEDDKPEEAKALAIADTTDATDVGEFDAKTADAMLALLAPLEERLERLDRRAARGAGGKRRGSAA